MLGEDKKTAQLGRRRSAPRRRRRELGINDELGGRQVRWAHDSGRRRRPRRVPVAAARAATAGD